MEETMGICSRRLEDIPELIHLIQSRLPEKEAARTSVLSKSWFQAWSTIPTLRLSVTKEHLKVIERTVIRYLRDNIPIRSFDLTIEIEYKELASLAEWIRPVAIKSCLRKLSLEIMVSDDSLLTMPNDVLLYAKNLDILRISCSPKINFVSITSRPVINCVSLRALELDHVRISEEVLDHIFSTCSLLEIIKLKHCKGFKTIKIKNLGSLYQLDIVLGQGNNAVLDINHVPKLRLFSWDIRFNVLPAITLPFDMVTQLCLGFLIISYGFLDTIETKFPFLNSLTLILNMRYWGSYSFDITCASLKRLSLLSCQSDLKYVHVNAATKLDYFCFEGRTMPRLVFTIPPVKQIKLALSLSGTICKSFFYDLKHALELSITCDIEITTMKEPVVLDDINICKRRTRFPCPATNVRQLSFKTGGGDRDDGMWELSEFFDGLFMIFLPKRVVAYPYERLKHINHFCNLMVSEVMEKETRRKFWGYRHWPSYLKSFKTKTEKGETIADYLTSYKDGSAPAVCVVFELKWII